MKKILLIVILCVSIIYANAQGWSPVPGWQSSYGSPTSITKHQGFLWAGSTQGIYKYNGSVWELTSSDFTIRDIRCLYSDGTDLYAGGLFTFPTYQALVLKWNGAQWLPVAYTDNTASGVWIAAILKTPTKLYIGGFFNTISATPNNFSNFGLWAMFDGITWTQPFPPTDGSCQFGVETLSVTGDSIYVAGGFSEIASIWTPSTFRFKDGGGMSSLDGYGFCFTGRDYQVLQNILYIGGTRRSDYANVDVGLAKRNGNTWLTVSNSMQLINTRVSKLLGKIYIAGAPSGGLNGIATNICSYDGTNFVNEGIGVSYPGALNVYPGIHTMFADTLANKLYAAGSFEQSYGNVSDYFAVKSVYGLPVRLSYFKAQISNNKEVFLSWGDMNPSDLNSYEVQVSTDAINFSKIGTVKGTDYLNVYSFSYKPPRCGQYFFRLKFDGNKTSDVLSVSIPCSQTTISFKQEQFLLKIDAKESGEVTVVNMLGQPVLFFAVPKGQTSKTLHLAPGMYVVLFRGNKESVTKKIFIQ